MIVQILSCKMPASSRSGAHGQARGQRIASNETAEARRSTPARAMGVFDMIPSLIQQGQPFEVLEESNLLDKKQKLKRSLRNELQSEQRERESGNVLRLPQEGLVMSCCQVRFNNLLQTWLKARLSKLKGPSSSGLQISASADGNGTACKSGDTHIQKLQIRAEGNSCFVDVSCAGRGNPRQQRLMASLQSLLYFAQVCLQTQHLTQIAINVAARKQQKALCHHSLVLSMQACLSSLREAALSCQIIDHQSLLFHIDMHGAARSWNTVGIAENRCLCWDADHKDPWAALHQIGRL